MISNLPPLPSGVLPGEHHNFYHGSGCVSASRLRVFARKPGGPQLYWQKYIAKILEDEEESEALIFGRALHTSTLEPEKFLEEFVTLPEDAPKRPTAAMLNAVNRKPESQARIEFWADFAAKTVGKTIISQEQHRLLLAMGGSIRSHRTASQLLIGGEREVTHRILQPGGLSSLPGIQCRPDLLNRVGVKLTGGRPFILDIKSCLSLDSESFSNFHRGAKRHAYHVQFGLYLSILQALGVDIHDFYVVACEKEPPFGVEVYQMSELSIGDGYKEAERLLIHLNECYEKNIWPNTEGGILPLGRSTFKYGRPSETGDE